MRTSVIAMLVWLAGIPLFVLAVAGLIYGIEEWLWRRDQKRGEKRLLILVARVDDDGPPHERRHS